MSKFRILDSHVIISLLIRLCYNSSVVRHKAKAVAKCIMAEIETVAFLTIYKTPRLSLSNFGRRFFVSKITCPSYVVYPNKPGRRCPKWEACLRRGFWI